MQINVLEYLEKGALSVCPEKTAVIDGDTHLTFRQLDAHSRQCAAAIIRRNGACKQPIAVFLPKGAQTVVADLGILQSGNFYTNLDVKSPPQRLKAILQNVQPALVITSASLLQALRALDIGPETVLTLEDAAQEPPAAAEALARRRAGIIDTDPLCIINTSGSTGIPKSVVLNHRSTIDFMDWVFDALALDGNESIGSLSPYYFDIFTLELNLCMAKGATMVVIPDACAVFPAKLVEFLATNAISLVFWVPTIMVNIANQNLFATQPLPALRKVLFAGEVFPTKSFNYWRRHLPGAMFVNLYGPIEISVDCTYFIVGREFADDEKLPIGVPCRNTDVLILNDRDELAGVNAPGELCVRGSSLAMGYWNDPEKTAKAFVQNPLNTHYPELIYRTGDLVFRNERGEIMFVGRKDFQIKHMGYRIELGEIEHAVMQLETIRNACVVYNPDRKEITLYYESDAALTPAAIRERMSAHVPKYMLPTVFHRMDALPRNPNGKIDRQALASQAKG